MAPQPPPFDDSALTAEQQEHAAAEAKKLAADQEEKRKALAAEADAAAQAAAAAAERVRAAAAALEKERRAAADLAHQAEEARRRADPPKEDDDDPPADDAAAFEAAVIANLHAQAAGVENIRTLVSVVLDPLSNHYDRWRDLVLLTLDRYALSSHVLSDAAHPGVSAWRRMDVVVLSWIYGAVTTEIMDSVRVRGGTARQAWLGIEAQFLGNSETRALRLDAEFRAFSQGELSVSDYCRQMKSMAAKLRDLGEVINDRTLVLNVLRGLNDKFGHMRIHFRRGPFPSFDEVRNELLLEELITGTPASSSPSALLANAPKSSGTPMPPAPSTGGPATTPTGSGPQPRPSTTASSGNSNRCRRRNKGNSPWPSLYNPWTGKITMWPNQGGDTGHQQGQQRPPSQQNAPNPRAGNLQTAQAFQQAQAYQQAMLAAYVQQQ